MSYNEEIWQRKMQHGEIFLPSDYARESTSVDKAFNCPYCNYSTDTKSNLTTHIRTHTGEKPYSCTVCSYRAAHKSNIKAHMKTHVKRQTPT